MENSPEETLGFQVDKCAQVKTMTAFIFVTFWVQTTAALCVPFSCPENSLSQSHYHSAGLLCFVVVFSISIQK